MTISLVVAAADNNAIGKDQKLLWCLPNDMKFFKNQTWGMVVIMGRKTLEALGKPLKGRKNIVISKGALPGDGIIAVRSLEEALDAAKEMDAKEVCVIGGGEIYKLALAKADLIYLTRVHVSPEDADTKHAYGYSFQRWERVQS